MSNHNEQMPHPAASPTSQSHDEHRAIVDEWMQRVIAAIQQMHLSEDTRLEVAKRLF